MRDAALMAYGLWLMARGWWRDGERSTKVVENVIFSGLTPQRLGKFGGPPETRTPDPLIKSQLLYQLS